MKSRDILLAAIVVFGFAGSANAQAEKAPVTADNFQRAETDHYFRVAVKQAGGIGKFFNYREPMAIDNQTVVRANRDTLYSSIVIDLDAGPATIMLPEADGRFMSLQAFNEDHYVVGKVEYGAGSYTFDKSKAGTRYLLVGIRTLVNPDEAADVEKVHKLQDAIMIEQPGGPGKFEIPDWDEASQKGVRDALLVLASTLPDTKRMFGSKAEVDPIRHLIGTASAWGGNPEKDALYLNVIPAGNDGNTAYTLTVPGDVPVDGFWSVSRYNAEGYYTPNKLNAYTLNNLIAKKDADGSVTIQFGDCEASVLNCLPIESGWNYMVRLYRPRASVLDGTWTFPEAKPR